MARTDAIAPSWAVVGESRPSWPASTNPRILANVMVGVAAGAIGAVVLIVHRLVAGPAGNDADQLARADMYIWLMAVVGVAAALVVVLQEPSRGSGTALLASPVASVTTAIGFFAMNTALGGHLNANFVEAFIRPMLALGLFGTMIVAAASLLLQPPHTHLLKGGLAAMLAAALLAGVGSYAVIGGHHVLLPHTSPTASMPIPRSLYSDVVARPLLDGRAATASALNTLKAEKPPNDVAAHRIRTEILPVIRQMVEGAESVRVDDPEVREVHQHAVAGAQLHLTGFEKIAAALELNNPELLAEGNALLSEGNVEWDQWAVGAAKL
jgi:hypothetical protein